MLCAVLLEELLRICWLHSDILTGRRFDSDLSFEFHLLIFASSYCVISANSEVYSPNDKTGICVADGMINLSANLRFQVLLITVDIDHLLFS